MSGYGVLADVAATNEGMEALMNLYATGIASGVTTALGNGWLTEDDATREEIQVFAMEYVGTVMRDPISRNVVADLIANSVAGIRSGTQWVPFVGGSS